MSGTPGTRIDTIEWGRIAAGGKVYRDAILRPDGAVAWDWSVTDMHHVPGIRIVDVEELAASGASTIILSRGMQLVLQVPAETVAWLEARGMRVEVLESTLAVARYNELVAANEPVAAMVHSTC